MQLYCFLFFLCNRISIITILIVDDKCYIKHCSSFKCLESLYFFSLICFFTVLLLTTTLTYYFTIDLYEWLSEVCFSIAFILYRSLTQCTLKKEEMGVIFKILQRVNGELTHLQQTIQVHCLSRNVQEVILSGCSHCKEKWTWVQTEGME